MRRLGEPYGKEPWEVMAKWSWERIGLMIACMDDEAKAEKERARRAAKPKVKTISEEHFIAGVRSG